MNCTIENKPVHIGKFLWKQKSKYTINGIEYLDYYITTGYSLVYFIVREDIKFQGEYFFFQYAKEENIENVRVIGTPLDFQVIETEYMDMDEMMRFEYFYPSTKAIVIPNFGMEPFYYFISQDFIKNSECSIYGYFNKNESMLLYELYNRKPAF